MKPQELDTTVLAVLAKCRHSPTYVIRNWIIGDFPNGNDLKTSRVLASCRRLEKRGLVREVPYYYAVMKEWEITDAGRAALENRS